MAEKIVMIIADNKFRDEEYAEPRQELEKAGYEVIVANKSGKKAVGMLGMEVSPDTKIDNINESDFAGIIFVGGGGASIYFNNSTAHKLAQSFYDSDKIVSAICIAPSTLANAGLLKGKNATCFSAQVDNLKSNGANYTGKGVEVDGRIITADGPKSATKFGKTIVKNLK